MYLRYNDMNDVMNKNDGIGHSVLLFTYKIISWQIMTYIISFKHMLDKNHQQTSIDVHMLRLPPTHLSANPQEKTGLTKGLLTIIELSLNVLYNKAKNFPGGNVALSASPVNSNRTKEKIKALTCRQVLCVFFQCANAKNVEIYWIYPPPSNSGK